jgi:predicted kinase
MSFTTSIVVVSGAPGAGKSSLAEPLAAKLEFPLLSKDQIKEVLYDALGQQEGDPWAWSRRLGSAAMELLWSLADRFPQVVLEANFRPHSEYERSRLLAFRRPVVEVHCTCPIEIAAARYSRRARGVGHHPVHVASDLTAELLAEFDGPMGIGPVIDVDTTKPIDMALVADEVIGLLGPDTQPERSRSWS